MGRGIVGTGGDVDIRNAPGGDIPGVGGGDHRVHHPGLRLIVGLAVGVGVRMTRGHGGIDRRHVDVERRVAVGDARPEVPDGRLVGGREGAAVGGAVEGGRVPGGLAARDPRPAEIEPREVQVDRVGRARPAVEFRHAADMLVGRKRPCRRHRAGNQERQHPEWAPHR